MLTELIAEAKELLAKAEKDVKDIEGHVDPTQLRVAVHRLGLFVEHLGQVKADPPASVESETADPADEDDGLDELLRDDLNERAKQEGIEDPEKLPNKGAVIDAIRAAVAEPADED